MPLPKIEINLDAAGFGPIKIDGVEIQGVNAIVIQTSPGQPSLVTMEIVPGQLSVEAEGILTPHILRAARENARTHSS